MIAKIWDTIVGHFYIILLWILDMLYDDTNE
jgi:hypothetical protein